MPVNKFKVEKAHKLIRAFYKGQVKSGNKMYAQPKPNAIVSEAMRKKHALREENVEKALDQISTQRRYLDDHSLYEYANYLIDAHYEQRMVIGNCFEMALLAAYYCWEIKSGTAWVVELGAPGDHGFCIVTDDKTPAWQTVAAFKDDKSDAWAVDPWANVCCPLGEYESRFEKKMDDWTSQGKRILMREPDGSGYEWMVPNSDTYLSGFAKGALSYVKFQKNRSNADKKGG